MRGKYEVGVRQNQSRNTSYMPGARDTGASNINLPLVLTKLINGGKDQHCINDLQFMCNIIGVINSVERITYILCGSFRFRNIQATFLFLNDYREEEKEQTDLVCQLLSRVGLFATSWTSAHQAPLSMRFSRQGYWSGLPFPSPTALRAHKSACTCSFTHNSQKVEATHRCPSANEWVNKMEHPYNGILFNYKKGMS